MTSNNNDQTEVLPSISMETLRAELKEWERIFAEANDGRKAEREDIKRDPDIAQKYKTYTKLRARSSTSISTSSSSPPAAKKRKLVALLSNPPPSRSTQAHAQARVQARAHEPHANNVHPVDLDPYDSPRRGTHLPTSTPSHQRTRIGPTPQRNGVVLGLFDLLSPASASKPSPLKPNPQSVLQDLAITPSKIARHIGIDPHPDPRVKSDNQGHEEGEDGVTSITRLRHTRTPQSVSKRIYLSTFLTPSTRRLNSQLTTPSASHSTDSQSSSVARKLRFDIADTPEFLRRDSQRSIMLPTELTSKENAVGKEEDDALLAWSPIKVRMPPKTVGRSLSALVRGLRSMQDERLDEELELLREMEAEEAGLRVPSIVNRGKNPESLEKEEDKEDQIPLGPDRALEEDSENDNHENELAKKDQKLKVWKKKGQKRTTRRVRMKPVLGKWKPEPVWKGEGEGEGEEAGTEEPGIPIRNEILGPTNEDGEEEKVKVKVKVAKKKISATAHSHANFRALKIKNKQSKAKGGGKGGMRFGRRR